MLHRKIIVFCSEVHAKHVNKGELYYRLISYSAVDIHRQDFKNQSVKAVWETIAVSSEIHTKHVNKAGSYYRLRAYRTENTVSVFTSRDI
jgi:uncharacterized C2H2 Zn-finger protein